LRAKEGFGGMGIECPGFSYGNGTKGLLP
jgi:hypothetical protein